MDPRVQARKPGLVTAFNESPGGQIQSQHSMDHLITSGRSDLVTAFNGSRYPGQEARSSYSIQWIDVTKPGGYILSQHSMDQLITSRRPDLDAAFIHPMDHHVQVKSKNDARI